METVLWVYLVLGILALALWIYAIADIVRGSLEGSGRKIFWLIIVIIFPILGAILYLLFGSRKSQRQP